jgi:putative PIN family toxin of toxin-antitoxin system
VVLDTSVLVAAMFDKKPRQILDAWRKNDLVWCCSKQVLGEYKKILGTIPVIRKKGLKLLDELENESSVVWVESNPKWNVDIEDPDDKKFVTCAVEAEADFLVSLDDHLLTLEEYRGVKIVRPNAIYSNKKLLTRNT